MTRLLCFFGLHSWERIAPSKRTWTKGDRFGYEHYNAVCARGCGARGWLS